MRTWHVGNSKPKLEQALRVLGALSLKAEDDYELVLRRASHQRSKEQNRRYWAIVNEIAEQLAPEGRKYSPPTWHNYFKGRFLGFVEEIWPNGKRFTVPASSSSLDVKEFAEYMTKVEAWAAQRGVLIEDPQGAPA